MADIAVPALDDSKDSWLVYADALQNAGDPRGELIMLSADESRSADRAAYLDSNAEAIFGSLAGHRGKLDIEWTYCVPETLTLKIGPEDSAKELIEATLRSPLGADMRTFRILAQTPKYGRVELSEGLALLAKNLAPSCTALELVDERAQEARTLVSSDYDPGRNLVEFGNLNAVWAIPHLQKLHMWVADVHQVSLGKVDAPELRDFSLLGLRWAESYGGPTDASRALSEANWPKLERLALRLPETFTYSWPDNYGAYVPESRYDEDNEYYYDDDEGWNEAINWSGELGAMLEGLQNTALEHLSLTSFASARQLLDALDTHGLPKTLRSLDLSQSDITDEHAGWMADHAGLFSNLKTLDLSDTLIDSPDALEGLAPEVVHSSGSGAIYRFNVGME